MVSAYHSGLVAEGPDSHGSQCYLDSMFRLVPTLALLLPACGMWIYEETTDDGTVTWYGTVLDGPYTGDNGVLSGGDVLVYDLDEELLAEGTEPYSDTPGYWKLKVPPAESVAIHLAGEDLLPTVWRGTTPTAQAYWYTGALFGYHQESWLPFLEQFDGQGGISLEPLGDEVCWLWGVPWDGDDWAGADITITGGDGEESVALAYTLDDEGLLYETDSEPIDYFFAFNLAPGDVTVSVQAADGRQVEETWPAWPGEIVSAWYLALPPEEE